MTEGPKKESNAADYIRAAARESASLADAVFRLDVAVQELMDAGFTQAALIKILHMQCGKAVTRQQVIKVLDALTGFGALLAPQKRLQLSREKGDQNGNKK